MEELIREYLGYEFLRGVGVSKRSRQGKKARILVYFSYVREKGFCVEETGIKEAQGFQGWLLERGRYKRSSIRRIIGEVRSFFDYVKAMGRVITNPFREIKVISGEKRVPGKVLKGEEMNRLLEELGRYERGKDMNEKKVYYRLHVLGELLYGGGLRISEASRLKAGDIEVERGEIKVKDSKTGRERICFLNEYARGVLEWYIKEGRSGVLRNKGSEYLFGAGEQSICVLMNKYLKKISKEIGVGEVSSHSFRHSLGYELLRRGCDIRYIQELLGHARLKSTEVYTRIEKEELKSMVDKYLPRGLNGGKGWR